MAKLMRVGREAQLATLDVDGLHCFRLISSVSDKKLREKFLKLENPTLADLTRIIRAYERVQASADARDDSESKHNVKVVQRSDRVKPQFNRDQPINQPRRSALLKRTHHNSATLAAL